MTTCPHRRNVSILILRQGQNDFFFFQKEVDLRTRRGAIAARPWCEAKRNQVDNVFNPSADLNCTTVTDTP
jgi:hypothetical protein